MSWHVLPGALSVAPLLGGMPGMPTRRAPADPAPPTLEETLETVDGLRSGREFRAALARLDDGRPHVDGEEILPYSSILKPFQR